MKNTVIGKANPKRGMIDFYVECNGESYYIFTRKFRKMLFNYFKNGVSVYKLFDLGRAHGNKVIINTLVQLKRMLKYVEEENGMKLLYAKRGKRSSTRMRQQYDHDLAA